jgi:hypothetical protein
MGTNGAMKRLAGLIACLMVVLGLSACGDDGASDEEIAQARREARTTIQERIADKRTARQLRHVNEKLKEQKNENQAGGTVTVTTTSVAADGGSTASSSGSKSFHAPSGNVSCQLDSTSATCAVASIGKTFTFDGGPASIEEGATLPRSYGPELAYGSSVSVGGVSCSVPLESEAKGIVCIDASTNHGFEASSVTERQKSF